MDWIVAHPAAATAVATMALVAVGPIIGGGQIAVVWRGISTMRRSGKRREREHERRHRETMDRMADERREARERHREAMESLAGQRKALETLIERTAPRPAPGECSCFRTG